MSPLDEMKSVPDVSSPETEGVLELRSLRVTDSHPAGARRLVDDVSLRVGQGEILGIVGESGCGKSMTAMAIMGLLPKGCAITSGSILLGGRNISALQPSEYNRIRGKEIGMVFQDPMSSLDPTQRVGLQVADSLRVHTDTKSRAARVRVVETLESVGLPEPAKVADSYPHQLSGGMRQRVMVAMAILCGPRLLICDEPTTALDVTVQKQVLDLLRGIRDSFGTSIVLITHDFGVMARVADRVAVMYAGQLVEEAPMGDFYRSRAHPYSDALLRAVPTLHGTRSARLWAIPGTPPTPAAHREGCGFADRCVNVRADCLNAVPALAKGPSPHHRLRCLHPVEPADGASTSSTEQGVGQ
ncbi:MAG: ABC transporter ATP-binding protein [Actinobacteria bacterium]|nr:ABC transporter ATP-binding protein [Actinomycetota bacterium]